MLKKRKQKELLREKNEVWSKLPSSLSAVLYVRVMQSTSIGKNDTLNYKERPFFLLFGTNRVMR